MIGECVVLSFAERERARRWAEEIEEFHRRYRNITTDRKQSSRETSLNIAIRGCEGEIAFGKIFGLPVNTRVELKSQKNDRGDFLWNKCAIDVKTGEGDRANLNVWIGKKDRCDIYALITRRDNVFYFRGAIPRAELHREVNKRMGTIGPYYSVSQDRLYELYPLTEQLLKVRKEERYGAGLFSSPGV